MLVSCSSSLDCSLFVIGMVPGCVGDCRMFAMLLSISVILSLSLGNGNATLVGSHVMVSAMRVALDPGL
jgi:hypothetical protein